MSKHLAQHLLSSVQGNNYWKNRIESLVLNEVSPVSLHLAVLLEPYLHYILEGKKTVESRFSSRRFAPYHQVEKGDVLLLKRSSGPIVALCEVANVWFYQLDRASWQEIKRDFTESLCAQDPGFWREREGASFATLMRIHRVLAIPPTAVSKRDRRGWVVLKERNRQLGFKIR